MSLRTSFHSSGKVTHAGRSGVVPVVGSIFPMKQMPGKGVEKKAEEANSHRAKHKKIERRFIKIRYVKLSLKQINI